jgi:hypothetical protein
MLPVRRSRWDSCRGGDGGIRAKSLFRGTADLPGFALSPDGKKVLISGTRDGIHEADLDRALAEGHAAFQQIYARPIWGLEWTAQGLFAGGENYGAVGEREFTLGLSTDGGRTFTPLMTVCDLQFSKCPADSTVGQHCAQVWEGDEAQQGLKEEFADVRCGRATAPDAGGGPPSADGGDVVTGGASGGSANGGGSATNAVTEGGGCACQAPARSRLPRAASLGIAFLVGLLAGRRNRSRARAS